MSSTMRKRIASYWHAEFLSSKDLICRSIVITLIYGVVSLAGLRQYTSILNGTPGSVEISRGLAAFLGLGYVCAFLAFVLLVPIFLIAAALLACWRRLARPKQGEEETSPNLV
jgi:hypothetical protein